MYKKWGKFLLVNTLMIISLFVCSISASAKSADIKMKTCVVAPDYITLNWESVPNASQYQISYKKSNESTYNCAYTTKTKFRIKDITKNSKYNIIIKAKVDKNYKNSKSFTITTYTVNSPSFEVWYNSKPAKTTLKCTDANDIKLNGNMYKAKSYQVFKINNSTKTLISTFYDTSYDLTSISKPHVAQKYGVRYCVNKKYNGISINYFSKLYPVTVVPTPNKITNLKATTTENNIMLSWSIPKNGADGYQIYMASNKSTGNTNWMLYTTIKNGKKTIYTLKKPNYTNSCVFKIAPYSKNTTKNSSTELQYKQNLDESNYSNTAKVQLTSASYFKAKSTKSYYSFNGYDGLIIVGDSRTAYMNKTPNITSKYPNTIFIAKPGSGYDWMSSTAIPKLEKYLNSNKKYIVVFNHGVNDLNDIDLYKKCYSQILSKYSKHKFYFMSVNPIYKNSKTDRVFTAPTKKLDYIKAFNKSMKSMWKNNYIDCYSYLIDNGYESYDGLHYEDATNTKIMNFILYTIDKNI